MPDYHISDWIRPRLPDSHWLGLDQIFDGDTLRHFDIYKGLDGQFYWHEVAPDGETPMHFRSEPFPSALAAHRQAVATLDG